MKKFFKTQLLLALLVMATAKMSGAQAQETSITNSWSMDITDVSGYAQQEEDQRMIKTCDGGSIGFYTVGDDHLFYAAQLIKMDASGNQLWSKKIQLGSKTTAKAVCESANGTLYMAGETEIDGKKKLYVTSVDKDGNDRASLTYDCDEKTIEGVNLLTPYNEGAIVAYATRNDAHKCQLNYAVVGGDVSDKKNAALDIKVAPNKVMLLGETLLAVTNDEFIGVNVNSGEYICDQPGAYYNATIKDGYCYLLSHANGMVVASKYAVSNKEVTSVWTTKLPLSEAYYMCYTYVDNEDNVYALIKRDETMDFAKLSSDGKLEKKILNINFGDDKIQSGFCYNFGLDKDGNYVFVGTASGFKMYVSKTTPDGKLISSNYFLMGDESEFAYSYSRGNQSYFADGKLYVCAYTRKKDIEAGYFTYFSEINIDNDVNVTWKQIMQPGATPYAKPSCVALDAEGNTYATITTKGNPQLKKIDKLGKEIWTATLADESLTTIEAYKIVTLDNGNVIVSGFVSSLDSDGYTEPRIPLWCFDKDGKMLWSKLMLDNTKYYYPRVYDMATATDGSIYLISNTYKPDMSGSQVVITKCSSNGDELWTNAYTYELGDLFSQSSKIDNEGNILVSGYAMGTDWINRAAVLKVRPTGNELFLNVAFTDIEDGTAYMDAWTDNNGYTHAVGVSQNNSNPIYAKIDKNGNAVKELCDATVNGVYNAVGGFDDKVVMAGAIVNSSSNAIDGFIKAIDLDGNDLWAKYYSDGNTCFLFSSPYDALTIAGYSIDANSNVKEVITKYDSDGNLATATSSSAIANPRADFTLSKAAFGKDCIATSSYFGYDRVITTGRINCYALSLNGTGIYHTDIKGKTISSIEYFDATGRRLNQRPLSGFYIQRNTYTDGTAATIKNTCK